MSTEHQPLPFQQLALVAAKQGGCFTRRQALAAGVSRHQIERALTIHEWRRVHPGVFTWDGAPVTPTLRQWAAIVACQDQPTGAEARVCAVSHRTAASLIGNHAFTADALTEISILGDGRPRLVRVQLHRTADLAPEWITNKYGPPTTKPERTLMDLATSITEPLLRKVMEEWLADRKVTVEKLRAAITEHRGRGKPGPLILARQLEDRTLGDEIADSDLEAELGDILRRHGVPVPEHHFVVDANGHVIAELDWAYPDSKVALEVAGYGVHLRSRERWEHDMNRHNELTSLGWAIRYYPKRALRRSPRKVALEIHANVRARAGTGQVA